MQILLTKGTDPSQYQWKCYYIKQLDRVCHHIVSHNLVHEVNINHIAVGSFLWLFWLYFSYYELPNKIVVSLLEQIYDQKYV